MAKQEAGGGFVAGLVVGAVAGAGLALIFAPQSGTETREMLRSKAEEAQGAARETAGRMTGDSGDQLRGKAEQFKSEAERSLGS